MIGHQNLAKLNLLLRKVMLRRLLKKPSPKTYSISAPEEEQKDYDFIMVRGTACNHKDSLLRSWNEKDNKIGCIYWPPENPIGTLGEEFECAFDELAWKSLYVEHRYRTWDKFYNNVFEAYLHDFFRVSFFHWWYQKFRNRSLVPVNPEYRILLLKTIVDKRSLQVDIKQNDLLRELHGPTIDLSTDKYRHLQDLEFLLYSLRDSGDIVLKDTNDKTYRDRFDGNEILPTPQAISTIVAFNQDETRHSDMVKLSKRQLWLGWGMFAIAAVTLIVEVRNWLQ